jgi:hypothetical protein
VLRPVFGAQEGTSLSPGVFSELRFDRNLLRPSAAGTPIAVHRDHSWESEGRKFSRLDCGGRVVVYFGQLDGTLGTMFGPYQHLSAVDGILHADSKRFAAFDEATSLWSIDGTELRCPVLVARAPD